MIAVAVRASSAMHAAARPASTTRIDRDGQVSYLLAGNMAFSEAQLRQQQLQGIAQDLGKAQQTLQSVWQYT